MHLAPNTLLQGGKYKIVRHISSGGFGNTYEAIHSLMDTRVAIKEFFMKSFCNRNETTGSVSVVSSNNAETVEKLKEKFVKEAKAIFGMTHENIVRVTDIFDENDTYYYVMDYVDGCSLNDILKKKGKLSESETIGYIRQVADALKYIHDRNRLHLDIKPGNIMLTKEGVVKLIDFGASKYYDEESGENTSTLMGINTKGFAPIEQSAQGFTSFSPATDIYALGATMYKLLTGVTPPDANLLVSEENALKPLPSYISAPTRNAVAASMRAKRKDRPQSIEEFLQILNGSVTPIINEQNGYDAESTVLDNPVQTPSYQAPKRQAPIRQDPVNQPPVYSAQSASSAQKNWKLIGGLAAAVVLAVLAAFFVTSKLANNSATDAAVDSTAIGVEDENKPLENVLSFDANGVKFNMMLVEAGSFYMGSNEYNADADERPVHKVSVGDYYIAETEVTQALWTAVMGYNPSLWQDNDNLPVERVSWDDCQIFVDKLNSITNRNFRLPTEAEWEFACKGGNKSGNYTYSGSNSLYEVAWYNDNSGGRTHLVKTKQPNELGLYDMTGNVNEWVGDVYANYSQEAQDNPTGPASGTTRVDRGGAWSDLVARCRVSNRYGFAPSHSAQYLGFRIALKP